MSEGWIRGSKYKVRYRIPSVQRYDREMVAVYLGTPDYRSNVPRLPRERQFSGRPEFGTTSLSLGWIKSYERVPDDTECYVDRRAPTEP
jgi:hypothetical protein